MSRTAALRRHTARMLTLALVASGLALLPAAAPASAEPLEVHVGSNRVNGKDLITRRIEVPFTTIESYKTSTLTEPRIYEGWHRCVRSVIRVLDTGFLSKLPNSQWTGYPNGRYIRPNEIGVYHPRSPNSYTTASVVDLAAYSAAAGENYGEGFGIVDGYSKLLRPEDSCGPPLPASDFKVPIVGVSAWDTAPNVGIAPVGASTSTYSFTAAAAHPVVKDIAFTYLWRFEGGPSRGGIDKTGPNAVASFGTTDNKNGWYRHWELYVFDENGNILANPKGRMQSLDVSLSRPSTDPVRVGEPFPVTLKVSAPTDNPGALTAIKPVTADVTLPDWVELVEGDLVDDFELAPGQSKTATLMLRAKDADTGELVATWRGTDAYNGTIEGIGRLDLTAVGTFAGDWFRTDNLADSVRQGDTAPIRLRVENETGEELTDVRVSDVSVTEPAEDGAEVPEGVGGAVLTPKAGPLGDTLAAKGPESVGFLNFDLEGVQPGEIELSATFTGKDSDGKTVTGPIAETWNVVERPLKVTVTPHLRKADGTLPELNLDNNGDGLINLEDHQFDVEVELSNDSEEPMTTLTFSDEAEPVDWSNNLIGEDQGAPKLKLLGVRGDPPPPGPDGKPLKGAIDALDVTIPDLAKKGDEGDSYTFTFVYEATGELDAKGQSIVNGKQGERAVRGSGVTKINFASGLLLEFSSWLKEPTRLTTSGQVVRLGGYLENLDEDKKDANGKVTKKGRSIAVWLTPVTEGNAGGGYLVQRDGGKTPLGAEFLELAPGQRMALNGILATKPTGVRTDAHVEYLVSAWNLPEKAGDQANPIAKERIDLVEDPDRGWGDTHDQRLQFADVKAQDLKACQTQLYDAIVTCNFYEGVKSMLNDTADAAKMAHAGVEQIGQATYWTSAWAMAQLADIAAALDEDPAAQARLAAELNTQLSTWYDLSILTGDAATTGVGALAEFIHQTHEVVKKGDTEAALAWVSKFAGENPDLLIGGIFKGRALAAMGQSALRGETRSAAGTIVREAVESQGSLATRRLAAEIDLAVARGIDPKTPSVLKGGLDVTDNPAVWRDVYGAARDDVQKMLQVAKEEGVLIAFRSRSPISIKLLEQKLAWLKPQSVKAKTVSAIDIKYLGFPADSLGKVVMVQPPFGAQLTGEALEAGLDAQMARLKKTHPELLDAVHAGEVRDRMKMRANKYHEHLAEWIDYAENGMPVGFEYGKNGVASGRDVSELRNVKLEVSEVPNPSGGPPLTRIDLKVAGANGKDFRHLTGDIDIVGFFNLDRSPIMNPQIREALYEKMRSLVGMQHGETMTWDHQKRAELLREHVGDKAETLLVASPDERLYTSVLDEKKSSAVAPEGNFGDTFSLLDGPPKELKSPARARGPKPTGRLTSIADDPRTLLQKIEPFLLPGNVIDRLKKTGVTVPSTEGQSKTATPLVVRPDGHIEAYVPSGDGPPLIPPTGKLRASGGRMQFRAAPAALQAAEPEDPGLVAAKAILGDNSPFVPRPDVGAQGGRWQTISLTQTLALDTPDVLDRPLQSWTDAGTRSGDSTLSVLTAAGLGLPAGDWFAPGDTVVVDPGGASEQLLTLTAVDGHSLTVDQPLTHRSDAGVQVLYLPKRSTTPGGPTTPDPGTPQVPGTQPLPDATASASPTPTSSPASTSPTPSAPAVPSVSPTTPGAAPTTPAANPTGGAIAPIPVQPTSCTPLGLSTTTTTMVPGQHGVVQVTGAAPHSLVELWAYSRPSTTPRIARMMLIDASGNGTVDNLVPSTNTRLYAVQRGCALDGAGTTVLNLRTALSIDAERERKKVYRFSGRIIPGTLPALVSLYRVAPNGRQVLTAQTTSRIDGTWTLKRAFLGADRYGFTARTGQTLTNAPGSSNVRSTVVH